MGKPWENRENGDLPSGKRLQKTMENHYFQWVNPLFLWPFSIAMLNYQRVMRFNGIYIMEFNGISY
jgi:hypothetical protein